MLIRRDRPITDRNAIFLSVTTQLGRGLMPAPTMHRRTWALGTMYAPLPPIMRAGQPSAASPSTPPGRTADVRRHRPPRPPAPGPRRRGRQHRVSAGHRFPAGEITISSTSVRSLPHVTRVRAASSHRPVSAQQRVCEIDERVAQCGRTWKVSRKCDVQTKAFRWQAEARCHRRCRRDGRSGTGGRRSRRPWVPPRSAPDPGRLPGSVRRCAPPYGLSAARRVPRSGRPCAVSLRRSGAWAVPAGASFRPAAPPWSARCPSSSGKGTR